MPLPKGSTASTCFAPVYDFLIRAFPVWKSWLRRALPHLAGPRVIEVSFGTGWPMTQYAGDFEAYGVDLNGRMVMIARKNLGKAGLTAQLRQGSVESLPYSDGFFDAVLSTMAFSGYPDAHRALSEMVRVLKPRGRLILIAVNYPANGNRLGIWFTRLWQRAGDRIRDMDALFCCHGLSWTDEEIGGWGSIHLYVAVREHNNA